MRVWMHAFLNFSNYLGPRYIFSRTNVVSFITAAGAIIITFDFCHAFLIS